MAVKCIRTGRARALVTCATNLQPLLTMKRLTIIATLHLAALEASAQRAEFAEYSIFGVGEAPDYGYDTFLAASQSPIAQNQVFFNRTDLTDLDQNWTWNVQMSNVSMSNVSLSNSDPPPNAYVALTTYNFGWPKGDNINNATRPAPS